MSTAGSRLSSYDSPVSNNGRGLKRVEDAVDGVVDSDSPVSNNGRGLKQWGWLVVVLPATDSPVSNNGRGLKRKARAAPGYRPGIRPLAITGVD